MSSMPSGSHAIALFPFRHARPNLVNHTRHFVSRHPRIRYRRKRAKLRCSVTVANAAGLHFNPHLARCRRRNFPLYQLKLPARLAHLRYKIFHRSMLHSLSCFFV
jgi:hypothetical protein